MRVSRWVSLGAVLSLAGCGSVGEDSETRPTGRPVLTEAQLREAQVAVRFDTHVKPILESRCLHCHSGDFPEADFNLETAEGIGQPGARGPRLVPGKPEASLLVTTVSSGNHGLSMPAVGMRMPDEEIEVLKAWIRQGAPWPSGPAGKLRERE